MDVMQYTVQCSGVAKDGGTRGGISWWLPFSVQKLGEDKKKIFAAKWVGFRLNSRWRPKKGLRRKISGFSIQMRIGTKQSKERKLFTANR